MNQMSNYYRKKLIERYAQNAKRAVGPLYNQKFTKYFQSLYESGEVPEPNAVTKKIKQLANDELRAGLIKSLNKLMPVDDNLRAFIMNAPDDELKQFIKSQNSKE